MYKVIMLKDLVSKSKHEQPLFPSVLTIIHWGHTNKKQDPGFPAGEFTGVSVCHLS